MGFTPKIRFSPVEEAVLAALGEEWQDLHELQVRFYSLYPPESIRSAVLYLRSKLLVAPLQRRHGHPLFEQTELGRIILAEFRRSRDNVFALPIGGPR